MSSDAIAPGRPAEPAAGRAFQLGLLATAVFLVFFQSQVVAPLIPVFAAEFAAPATQAGLLVPAYALPYGVMALVYGPLSDRFGRRRVVAFCIGALAVGALAAAFAPTLGVLLLLRVLAGISAGGVVPVSLAYVADYYAYRERGQAIGVTFGAVALGQGVGYSLGPALEPWAGWRAIFVGLAAVAGAVLALLLLSPRPAAPPAQAAAAPPPGAVLGFRDLLRQARARRIYALIVLGGLCSSGVASWFGVYAHERYGMGSLAIGGAYLAYGLLGSASPLAGVLADRIGRSRLIPTGLATIALGAALLAVQGPLAVGLVGLSAVSLGLQFTYPLLAGLASEFAPYARGRALGLNTFSMFMGVGSGSLLVGALLPLGFAAP
jgi:predicted MFS family arabinose efflux permease